MIVSARLCDRRDGRMQRESKIKESRLEATSALGGVCYWTVHMVVQVRVESAGWTVIVSARLCDRRG